MMNIDKPKNKIAYRLDLLSKYSAVLLAAMIPISTGVTGALFIVTILLFYCAGNYREKFRIIFNNRIALLMLALFALFIIGLTYSAAPLHDGLFITKKYSKLFLGVLLFPLLQWDKVVLEKADR